MPNLDAPGDQVPVDQLPETLMEAIHRVQKELPKLHKDSENPDFKSKYISLNALMDAVLPVLNRNGLVWVTAPTYSEGKAALNYRLIFAEVEDAELEGTMFLETAKDDPQGQGSGITYARRYSLEAVLGLTATVDDDGNAATESRRRQEQARGTVQYLTEDQRISMDNQILRAGLEHSEVYREAGISNSSQITPEQARKVKKLIDDVGDLAELPVDGAA